MARTTRRRRPSDLSDAERGRLAPLLPCASPDDPRQKQDAREILNAILSVLRTGSFWRELLSDIPPWRAVHLYLHRRQLDGSWRPLLQDPDQRPLRSVISSRQYTLSENDGSTWVPLDPINLCLTIDSPTPSHALLSGYANLVALNPRLNVHLGISVREGSHGDRIVVVWQEAGGSMICPVFLQAAIPLRASTTYRVELVWKSNRPMILTETIVAGIDARSGPAHSPSGLIALILQSG